jgi:hypothetical protein
MAYDIIKTLSTSFPNGLNAGQLHLDIETAGMTSATLLAITTNADTDQCIATFDVEPNPTYKAIYDTKVSEYNISYMNFDSVLSTVLEEHFLISNINEAVIGKNNWTKTTIGANSQINKRTFPGRPGIIQLVAGLDASGTAAVHIGSTTDGLAFETGTFNRIECETYFMIENSISSSDFDYCEIGFSDDNDTNGLPQNAGAIFFDPSESPNIQFKTIVAGVQTAIVTDVPIVLDTWYQVKFIYSNLATNPMMSVIVDGVFKGSINFAMPLTSTPFSPTIKIDGKLGGSSVKLNVDYFIMKEDYNYNI